ncbi:hypothetical protein RE628_04495 [Paenibacillus sp. D2_2]|uniref:hypothetical protein n=1 Tax=Paenibacillus sp. D2_2 TaxID=3073092 RepID=UPI002814EEFC|nr:hypothetical protein [Paenibacillus sp. D2_2]WMT41754.1 hypothetical protein RE628_04495 [Paenibacillus sp. D2_2]
MKIYESADSKSPILHSLSVQEGQDFIRQERVPLSKNGGKVYYELKQSGKPDSERLEYTYGATDALNVDQASLKDLVNRYSSLHEADYIPSTWASFSEALANVKSLLSSGVNAGTAEVMRVALEDSALALRYNGNTNRLKEVCDEYETKYTADQYSDNSFARFHDVLEQTRKAVEDSESGAQVLTGLQLEKLRIDLDSAVNRLVVKGGNEVISVAINPNDIDGKIGTSVTFKPEVTVGGNAADTVTWKVSGNTSVKTTISNGVLNIADDEKVDGTLTVTATSTFDPTKSGTAKVLVVSELIPKIIRVTIPDQVDSVKAGTIQQFTANVEVKNNADTSVTWEVENADNVGTIINNGLLMVDENETADELTIKATSVVDPTKFAAKTVKVEQNLDKQRDITIDAMVNGTVTADMVTAKAGETVTLIVTPDVGYQLKPGSLKVNGEAIFGTRLQCQLNL